MSVCEQRSETKVCIGEELLSQFRHCTVSDCCWPLAQFFASERPHNSQALAGKEIVLISLRTLLRGSVRRLSDSDIDVERVCSFCSFCCRIFFWYIVSIQYVQR